MQSESRVDPKIIEEILKFSKNVIEAPNLVPAPDEISLEVTSHDVVQNMDKTRLSHYKKNMQRKQVLQLTFQRQLLK